MSKTETTEHVFRPMRSEIFGEGKRCQDCGKLEHEHNGETPAASKRIFETFAAVDQWRENQMTSKEPYCFNGKVAIRKYRITVEEIEEPKEVLERRLRKLWAECDNHHHWAPIQAEARKLNITLEHAQ